MQGQTTSAAVQLSYEAKALAHAGCFAIVIECVPSIVGKLVTDSLSIPTVGIGAGPDCDGQVLVFHDLLGMHHELQPKFVRSYANIKENSIDALSAFASDVRSGNFPSEDESYQISDEEAEALGLYGSPLPKSEDPLASW